MRTLFFLFFFGASIAHASTHILTDAEISKALVGTWKSYPTDKIPVNGRTTYNADGTGFELVWPANLPESAAVRIDTTWSVTNQILVIISIKSSNSQIVPVGLVLRDHILTISADQFTFEPFGGYEGRNVEQARGTKYRVKPNTKSQ